MNYIPTTGRRVLAAAAAAVAGLAISTAAYAATTSGTASTAASVPMCTASDLGAWVAVDQANGAAGTIYFPLEFTNLSGHTCSLFGFPGVSALGHQGRQLGSPANWIGTTAPRTVILAPGATAHTVLAYHDAAVSTEPGCDPASSVVLRIYPPDQYTATLAAFGFEACSHPGPFYLGIFGPIIAGLGTING